MLYRALALILLCGVAQAAGPALFFTDIISGPKSGGQDNLGAFITIYGEGFGSVRGSSRVTIGGREVARYVIWGEDNAVARRLDMIVVQPGPNVTSGNIIVAVNGIPSNALPFKIRPGKIFFVIPGARNASDANPGTFDKPFETLHRRRGQMRAGDIVYVKGGTFNSADPRAPGWDCVICFFPDNDPRGTASAPVSWIGYPGDPPVLGAPQPMRRAIFLDSTMQHYVIANMKFTHYGGMLELSGNWRRIIGNYIYDGIDSNCCAIGIAGDSANYKIYGNFLRNNGIGGEKMSGPGFYLQGFGINRNIDFGWNHIQDHHGSRPIQVYGHVDGDFVHEIRIHDNLITGSELNNIVLGGSDGGTNILGTVYVYNNIILGASDPGLRVNDPEGKVIIKNNVLYDNGSPGMNGSNAQLYIERAGAGRIILQNNIFYARQNQSYIEIDADAGNAAINASNNLYFNAGKCPSWDINCVTANPMFMSPARWDFRLKAQSPAIDQGAPSGISRDFLGVRRPQGAAYDIGAHEYEL